jgi:phosphoserine phosphatase
MTDQSVTVLVVCDVDSTLFNEEGIDAIALAAGAEISQKVASITAAAMAGEMDFADSLRERVKALEGTPVSVIQAVSEAVTATEGAQALIGFVHGQGGKVCAVSGGFHELIDPLATRLGVDLWRANRLGVRDGVLSGEITGPLIDSAAKKASLQQWADQWGVPQRRCVAVGDGANDLEMLEWAGLGIGFAPKPVVAKRADVVLAKRDLRLVIPHLEPLL